MALLGSFAAAKNAKMHEVSKRSKAPPETHTREGS